jgi:hypothetical protein
MNTAMPDNSIGNQRDESWIIIGVPPWQMPVIRLFYFLYYCAVAGGILLLSRRGIHNFTEEFGTWSRNYRDACFEQSFY